MMKRKIVCLCGSTRFREAFERAAKDETLKGNVVLSVGMFGHQEGIDMDGPIKKDLDALHKDKIDMADEVLFLNVGKYVGHSTLGEFLHAYKNGKIYRFLEPITRTEFNDLLVKAVAAHPFSQEVPAGNTRPFLDVHLMHEKFWGEDLRVKVRAMLPDFKAELLKFRLRFIDEEIQETKDATSPEEFVDGLIDTMVVIIGTLHMFGVDGELAWEEVHKANMKKERGVKGNRPNKWGFPDLIKPAGWVGPDHRGNTGILSEVIGNPVTEDKLCDTTGTTDCTKNP